MKLLLCECDNGHVRSYAGWNTPVVSFEEAAAEFLAKLDVNRANKVCHVCGSPVRVINFTEEEYSSLSEILAAIRKRMVTDKLKNDMERTYAKNSST